MPSNVGALCRAAVSAAAALLTCAATCAVVSAAEPEHPDFTGLWQGSRDGGRASGFGGPRAELPFTEEGRRRTDEYRKLLGPEQANPAAY